MKKIYVLLAALLLSLLWNLKLFSENAEFRHIALLCASKKSPDDWYNQYQIQINNRDINLANLYLSISAQLGHAEAQFKLGKTLLDAGEEKPAEEWMTEAAEQGNAEHQYQLGRCYDYVFTRDPGEEFSRLAFKWYNMAATQNHAKAALFLAQCYRLGKGCMRDLSAAEYWYKKASELGENVNMGLAEVYIETNRPELAAPLLSAEANAGSKHARNRLNECFRKRREQKSDN